MKMWPLKCTQSFSKIWTSEIVFDQTWPMLGLVRDFIKTSILTKFNDYHTENVATRAYIFFSRIWPSDLVFDQTWPISELIWNFNKTNILTKFHDYQTMWPLERTQGKKLTPHDGLRTTDDRHSSITIAHSEHFVLRWAKNEGNGVILFYALMCSISAWSSKFIAFIVFEVMAQTKTQWKFTKGSN